jgi:hypothetical protein
MPGKPTLQSEAGRSPAKRDLDTIFISLSDALNIWLAFKRTTCNVCAFYMAARTVAALIVSGAFFFEQGIPLTAPSLVIDRSRKASRMSGMPSALREVHR